MYKLIGEFIATKHFISRTPDFLLSLPVVPGHDDGDQLMWRCQFDERITIPLASLPEHIQRLFQQSTSSWVNVETHYRCNNSRWFLVPRDLFLKHNRNEDFVSRAMVRATVGPKEGAKDSEAEGPWQPDLEKLQQPKGGASGPMTAAPATPHVAVQYSDGKGYTVLSGDGPHDVTIATHCRYEYDQGYTGKKKPANWVAPYLWCTLECGLVLSAVSQWNLTIRSKGAKNGRHGWACQHCAAYWSGKKEGSRMLTISDEQGAKGPSMTIQVICKEPPQTEWNAWAKSRIEFYKRFEPNEPLRDEPALTCPRLANQRVRLEGLSSDLLWTAILGNPDTQLMANLEKLYDSINQIKFVKAKS